MERGRALHDGLSLSEAGNGSVLGQLRNIFPKLMVFLVNIEYPKTRFAKEVQWALEKSTIEPNPTGIPSHFLLIQFHLIPPPPPPKIQFIIPP